jgi:hypothetical protein
MGYYQASHEIGLVRGYNNKADKSHVISPKWIYNMVNFGQNRGSAIDSNYEVLSQNGAVSLLKFPYDKNYLAWDMKPVDWIAALNNRMALPTYISGVNENPQNLRAIKELLNNGHVLTFATFVASWLYTKIKSHPDADNRFVGEGGAYWVQGRKGAHMMTIVGYNDNIWIDVNGNGQIDPGEMGAFLVANSWGDRWGNKGFTWISYDAFLSQSAVPNPPNLEREPAASIAGNYLISCLPKATEYAPKLIAQFKLGQTEREQIRISAGVSDANESNPQRYFSSGAISFQGGPYRFDGTTSNEVQYGTFALDLTDLATPNTSQKFYLIVRDGRTEKPTYLNAYRLIDMTNGNVVRDRSSFPHKVDYDKITHQIQYNLALPTLNQLSLRTDSKAPHSLRITYPLKQEVVKGVIPVTLRAQGGAEIAHVDFYLDDALFATDTSAPFWVLLDSEKYSNGTHELTVVGCDKLGQPYRDSVKIHIDNSDF